MDVIVKGFGSSKLTRLYLSSYRAALAIMRLQRIFKPYVLAALRSIQIDEGGNGEEGHQSLQDALTHLSILNSIFKHWCWNCHI